MNALEERRKKHLYTASKNTKLFVDQPPKELFVVVNNHGKKEMPLNKEEIVETMSMPAQPSGYIKYPKYDLY